VLRRCVAGRDGAPQDAEKYPLTVELVVGVRRDQPGVFGSLLADERSSRPPDIGDDVPQAIGVRGPHASAADALFEGDASREHAVVGHAPGPLVIGDHRRKLSRQPIIHDRMISRDGAGSRR